MSIFALVVALLAAAFLVLAVAIALRRPLPSWVEARAKKWWQSKTLWFNLLSVVAAGMAVAESLDLQSQMPPWAGAVFLIVVAMVNAGLRLVTTRAITLTDSPDGR